MPTMRELDEVDAGFIDSGPNRTVLTQPVDVSSRVLFDCLADGDAWKEWLGIDVEWTTPEPRGPGTTRTVSTNGQVMEEYFFDWNDGESFSFRFDRATLPLKAFGERYVCRSTSPDSAELEWTYNYEWGGPLAPVAGRLFGAVFGFNARRSTKKLAHLLATEDDRWR